MSFHSFAATTVSRAVQCCRVVCVRTVLCLTWAVLHLGCLVCAAVCTVLLVLPDVLPVLDLPFQAILLLAVHE